MLNRGIRDCAQTLLAIAALAGPWSLVTAAQPDFDESVDQAVPRALPNQPNRVSPRDWKNLEALAERSKLLPRPDGVGGPEGRFGYSVSIDRDRALVGGIDQAGGDGAAVIFERSGNSWIETAFLRPPPGPNANKQFGVSVSLSGDRALIGADRDTGPSSGGSAYVFDFDGVNWSNSAKLTVEDPDSNNGFGNSVSLDGDRALIGASLDSANGQYAGAAYIFDFNGSTWRESALLTPSDIQEQARFGTSVSLSGDRALIGAVSGLGGTIDFAGAAYVFDFDGAAWAQSAKLSANEPQGGAEFGASASLAENRALIGAPRTTDIDTPTGAAFVFDFDGSDWNPSKKIIASDGEFGDRFGQSVSLSGDRALIGAHFADNGGGGQGVAYLFEYGDSAWNEISKLTSIDCGCVGRFGFAASISGDRALLGAPISVVDGTRNGAAFVFEFDGTSWPQTSQLAASEGALEHRFGSSVAIWGTRALVGAPQDSSNGSWSGSAYVFDRNGDAWIEVAKLTASNSITGAEFGRAVSLLGDRALIGAPGYGSNSAYVFEFDGSNWIETAEFTASDGELNDEFGISVSLSGDRALVGSRFNSGNSNGSGAAYIFEFEEGIWSETAKLSPSDGASNDQFGISVSLRDDRALIGSWLDDDFGDFSGSAYIFDYDGVAWTESIKITPSDSSAEEQFGYSVSLSANRALISARLDDVNGYRSGAAYIFDFDNSNWSEAAKLFPGAGDVNDFFGNAVSLSGDTAIVGAIYDSPGGQASGAAYRFELNQGTWDETASLSPSDSSTGDLLGEAVSIAGDYLVVGAPGEDDRGSQAGAAYVFDLGLILSDGFEASDDLRATRPSKH